MLKKRVITGFILLLIFLSCVFFFSDEVFYVFISLFFLISAWEWCNLSRIASVFKKIMFLIVCIFLCYQIQQLDICTVLPISLFWLLCAIVLLVFYSKGQTCLFPSYLCLFMGILTLIPAWFCLVTISTLEFSESAILYVFSIVAMSDTGAYFFGKKFGKNKLASNISPKKTIEGLFGGVLCSILCTIIFALYENISMIECVYISLLSGLLSIFVVIGDLFESMLKRQSGIKDSGKILPGHGGILDRIDGLLFALPLYTVFLVCFGGTNYALQ